MPVLDWEIPEDLGVLEPEKGGDVGEEEPQQNQIPQSGSTLSFEPDWDFPILPKSTGQHFRSLRLKKGGAEFVTGSSKDVINTILHFYASVSLMACFFTY